MNIIKGLMPALANAARTSGTRRHAAAIDHVHSGVGESQRLFAGIGLNFNVTTDQALTKFGAFTSFIIERIRVYDASTSLTTAQGSLYTGAGKTGIVIMTTTTVFTGATGATVGSDIIIAPAGLDSIAILTAASLFLSLTTAQGGAATASMLVIGIPLSEP